jgi:hypothetical protein
VFLWTLSGPILNVVLPQKMAVTGEYSCYSFYKKKHIKWHLFAHVSVTILFQALIWNNTGDEIIAFSQDGCAVTIAVSNNAVEIVDDMSAMMAHAALSMQSTRSAAISGGGGGTAGVDDKGDELDDGGVQEDSVGGSLPSLRFEGADASAHGLYQAISFT